LLLVDRYSIQYCPCGRDILPGLVLVTLWRHLCSSTTHVRTAQRTVPFITIITTPPPPPSRRGLTIEDAEKRLASPHNAVRIRRD